MLDSRFIHITTKTQFLSLLRLFNILLYLSTTVCKIDGCWEPVIQRRELSPVLSDDLEGWNWGWGWERSKRKELHVCTGLIHFVVLQRLAQHCKATVCQLKIYKNFKKLIQSKLLECFE